MPGETKGQGTLTILAILREQLGPASFEAFVSALPAGAADVVRNPPLPLAWLPAEHYFDILDTLYRAVWPGHPERIEALARERMRRDLRTIYKVLMRVLSPEALLAKGAAIWSTYTRGVADMTVSETRDRHALISYAHATLANPAFWHFQCGAIPGILEIGGSKNVRAKVVEGGGHEPRCVIAVDWD